MPPSNSIFISYRRSDSNDVTGRIYDRLLSHFGRAVVFKDVDSIPYGEDFRAYLMQTVGSCQVVVAVIGPTWLNTLQQRLNRTEQDWVRAELETALSREIAIPVIPLLVGGAKMPDEGDLPTSLKLLVHRNAAQARPDPDFHQDLDRLIQQLEAIVGSPDSRAGSAERNPLPQPTSAPTAVAQPISSPSSSQSLIISGATISGQVGQAGGDLTQTQYQYQGEEAKPLTPQTVVQLIAEIEALLRASALPEGQKDKVLNQLKAAKEEVCDEEPDKPYVARKLRKVTTILQETDAAVGAGKSLWEKVAPIINQLLPWLGVTSHFFGL
jgi:hypothetical protein